MPNSYLLYTANGSNTDFSLVGIDGWISSAFLKVYLDNVLQNTGYSFQGLTTANPFVRFTTAPTNGVAVRLQRETPATVSGFQGNIVNFNDASVLTENDLDNMAKGLLHITQEAEDTGSGALGKTADELNWNAENKRITALAQPTASTDAANKGYVDGITMYGTGLATPQSWTLSGNDSTSTFTLPSPVSSSTDANTFLVEIGGIIQRPITDYTIPNTTTIAFASPPVTGNNNIRIRNFGAVRNIAAYNDSVTFAQNATVNGNLTVDTNTLVVNAANNRVGINNANPAASLSVQSTNNTDGIYVAGTSPGPVSTWIQIIPNAGSGTFNPLTQPGDRLVAFGTTGANETSSVGLTIAPWSSSSAGLRMTGTGAIGIGLTSPQHPLDIRGITRISNSTTSGYGFVQYGSSATATNNFHFGSEGDGNFNLYNGNVGAGSKVFGITSTGTVNLNGQLAFPATQNASSDVNTLDDYEEGTWTPTLTAVTTAPTGVTYSTNNSAWYVKIGRTVWIGGWLYLTNKGTGGVGSIYIDNIPFKGSYAGYHQGITIGIAQNLTSLTAGSVVSGYINSPGNIMLVSSGGATGSIGNIVYSCVTDSTNIVFSGIYRVNN